MGLPKNGLPCPKCGGNQARIIQEGHHKRVVCPQCQYSTWLKHYRAELKEWAQKEFLKTHRYCPLTHDYMKISECAPCEMCHDN